MKMKEFQLISGVPKGKRTRVYSWYNFEKGISKGYKVNGKMKYNFKTKAEAKRVAGKK